MENNEGKTARHPAAVRARARRVVLQRDGYRCRRCGRAGKLEIDHRRPLWKGGGNELENLQALCRDCHIDKSRAERERPVTGRAEWRRRLRALRAKT